MKVVKIEDYENFVAWFESVYRGKPVEIDLMDREGEYGCTIVYFKKTNPKDVVEMQKYKNKVIN